MQPIEIGEKPKQFCKVLSDLTLIEQVRNRIELILPSHRIFYALSRTHERYFWPLLSEVLLSRMVIQPLNRGTAPAVLYSLLRLGLIDPDAHVALFPSDFFVSNDRLLMSYVERSFDTLAIRPDLVIVLGMTPDSPATEHNWIEPASAFACNLELLFRVRRFIERPPVEVAQRLCAHGRCFWNSSIVVARLVNLLALMIDVLPNLYDEFGRLADVLGTEFESEAVECTYRSIRGIDFNSSVLSARAFKITMMRVDGLFWNDLDSNSEVLATLEHIGVRPKWLSVIN